MKQWITFSLYLYFVEFLYKFSQLTAKDDIEYFGFKIKKDIFKGNQFENIIQRSYLHRNTAVGLFSSSARIGGILAPLIALYLPKFQVHYPFVSVSILASSRSLISYIRLSLEVT